MVPAHQVFFLHLLKPYIVSMSTRSSAAAMATTSTVTTTTITSNQPLGHPFLIGPRNEDTVRAERKAIRSKITKAANKAAAHVILPLTDEECLQWLEELEEY